MDPRDIQRAEHELERLKHERAVCADSHTLEEEYSQRIDALKRNIEDARKGNNRY